MHHLSVTSKYKCLPAEQARHCLPIVSKPFQRFCLVWRGRPYIRSSDSAVSVMFFNSSSPLGDCRERNSLSLGVTSEECPCTCIPPSRPHSKGKSALRASPALLQTRWCSRLWVPASLLWDDPNAEPRMPWARWGWAVSRRCRQLGGPRALFSACRPQCDLSSLVERQAPELACTVCSPRLRCDEDVWRAAGRLRCARGAAVLQGR